MNLQQVLAQFPMFSLAQEQDAPELNLFFQHFPMRLGQYNMYYQFQNLKSYWDFQGEKTYPFIWRREGEILAYWSLSVRQQFVSGQAVRAAYVGDLRVRTERMRELNLSWKKEIVGMVAALAKTTEFAQVCPFYFSLILSNAQALKAFTAGELAPFVHPLFAYTSFFIDPRNFSYVGESGRQILWEKEKGRGAQFLKEDLRQKSWAGTLSTYPQTDYLSLEEEGRIVAATEVIFWQDLRSIKIELSEGRCHSLPSLYWGEMSFAAEWTAAEKETALLEMIAATFARFASTPLMFNLPQGCCPDFKQGHEQNAMLFQFKFQRPQENHLAPFKQSVGPISAAWM